MHYELTDLKVLIAVAEEGSVTRGASRCNLAPSSVSIRLKNLEDSLGATPEAGPESDRKVIRYLGLHRRRGSCRSEVPIADTALSRC